MTVENVRREFRDIPLTDEEEAAALLEAFRKKAVKLQQEQKDNERRIRIEKAREMWSYAECRQHALQTGQAIGQQRGFEFVLDADNKEVFDLLAKYFSNDKSFEEEEYFGRPYSLNKGICLLSPVRGNGKTTLLDCFMYNKRSCYIKVSTKGMARDYEKAGLDKIDPYLWLLDCPTGAVNFYQSQLGIHYDDFGDEREVMFMGNRMQISSTIINSIYDDHRDDNMFWKFHISMNYKWSEYEQKYGSNTASRLEEMFNLIPVPGNSRRK